MSDETNSRRSFIRQVGGGLVGGSALLGTTGTAPLLIGAPRQVASNPLATATATGRYFIGQKHRHLPVFELQDQLLNNNMIRTGHIAFETDGALYHANTRLLAAHRIAPIRTTPNGMPFHPKPLDACGPPENYGFTAGYPFTGEPSNGTWDIITYEYWYNGFITGFGGGPTFYFPGLSVLDCVTALKDALEWVNTMVSTIIENAGKYSANAVAITRRYAAQGVAAAIIYLIEISTVLTAPEWVAILATAGATAGAVALAYHCFKTGQ